MLLSRCRPTIVFLLTLVVTTVIPALDAQAAVERTQGAPSVSSRGTAQYVIPFTLPPGVNGMTPSLALSYSQETDNGIIGIGFSISGLSEISRCSKSIALDGGGGPATLSISDAYCLGGNRLRLTSGGYGQTNSTYQTAIEIYARANVTGANANGPTSWEIRKKDGLIYEYGNTEDSRVETVGLSAIRAWALNKISDRSGNSIEFVYQEDVTTGAYRPLEVRYGKNANAGTAHTTKVAFVYEAGTRPDPIYSFEYGVKGTSVTGPVHEFKRLDRIDVIDVASSTTVRTYDLTYEAAGGAGNRSRLSTIQESRGSDTLPPTTIQWTSGTPGWASTEISTGVTIPYGFLRADINGDNRADVLFSSSATSGGGAWHYMLGTETGFGPDTDTTIPNTNYASAQLIDWNGDGMMDLLVPCNGTSTWCVMVASGSGFLPLMNTSASSAGNQLVTDVNCDGLDDLVRLDTSGLPNRIFTSLRSGAGFAPAALAWTSPLSIQKFSDFNPTFDIRARSAKSKLDFNGDGCADFVVSTRDDDPEPGAGTLYAIAPFLGTSGGVQDTSWLGEQTTPIPVVAAGDFNGDGQTDLVMSRGTNSFVVYMGSGGKFATAMQGPSIIGFADLGLYVGDYDGDGLDDMVMPQTTTKAWHVSRSTGNGFSVLASMGYSDGAATHPADMNGDGGVDLIGASAPFGNVLRFRMRNAPFPDFVDRITDGFDMYVDFDYVRLTNAGNVYTKGTGSVFPTLEYQGPLYVVSRMTTSTGTGSTYDISYKYEAARLHLQGHGFLGFVKRTQTDSRNGVRTEETYLQDTARYEILGAPSLVQVRQSSGTLMAETSLTWSVLSTGAGSTERRFPYVASQVMNRYEVGGAFNGSLISTTTTTTEGIDATSGFIYDSKTTFQEASSANGAQPGASYVQRTYHPLGMLSNDPGSNWCIGRPGQTQQINSHAQYGGETTTHKTDRTWDASKCRVTQEVIESGNATRQVTTDLGYDAFGNVNAMTVTGKNPDGTAMGARVSSADWGANGRFLRSTINPLTQQISYDWDESIGMRTRVTDPNQLQTSWIYDNFGRVTRVNRPDGTTTTVSYNDCTSEGCLDSNNKLLVIQSELDANGAIIRDAWTYLDRYNRPLATRSTLLSGAFTQTERRYDSLGRVAQESAPCHWASCTFFWTVYSYDAANRVTQVSRPTSQSNPNPLDAYIYYEGLTTRRLDTQSKQSTDIANVVGQTLRTVNHDGYYVQVDYDAFGHPLRVTDSALTLQTATFDVSGFRTGFGILGAGARAYTYNSIGEMLSQTDSKGQSTTYGYDPIGRLTSRVDAQGPTNWVWGTSATAKNIGRLESKTGPTGVSESYLYDAFGRPSQTAVALGSDGTHFVNYSYNALGTLDTLTYPTSTSSYRLKLKYDYAYGQLLRIKDFAAPTTVFWAADAANARGQITQESLGNGLVTTRNFDAITGSPGFIRTGPGGGSAIQNLSYLWDAMGNLIQRQDANQGLTENFYYDNLYRIDYAQLNSSTNLDLAYDGRGNVTSKQDASDTTPEAGSATWLASDLPDTLGGASPQGSGSSQFLFDADGSRYKQVATQSGATETTLYIGGLLERVTSGTVTSFRHYIQTPTGTAVIYTRNSTGANTTYYTLRDHLGSTDKITDGTGAVTIALSYAAYGQRRGSNWTGTPSASDWTTIGGITHRGFTGHEHLDNLGLIHMNGRVYQPTLGRFLSSDPFIDQMQGTQAFNRYAYLGNGPLSGIDPGGFMEEVVVTAPRWRPSSVQILNLNRGVAGPNYFRTRVVRRHEWSPPVASEVLEEVVSVATRYQSTAGLEQLLSTEGFDPSSISAPRIDMRAVMADICDTEVEGDFASPETELHDNLDTIGNTLTAGGLGTEAGAASLAARAAARFPRNLEGYAMIPFPRAGQLNTPSLPGWQLFQRTNSLLLRGAATSIGWMGIVGDSFAGYDSFAIGDNLQGGIDTVSAWAGVASFVSAPYGLSVWAGAKVAKPVMKATAKLQCRGVMAPGSVTPKF